MTVPLQLDIGQGRSRDTINILGYPHVGWGRDGWKRIDICPKYEPDECYDVTGGIREKDATVTHIWMGDVIEHLPRTKIGHVLSECHRVLEPGGELLIVTPDMEKVMPRWFAFRGMDSAEEMSLSWLIWGEQDESGNGANASADTHRHGFTEFSLAAALAAAGFVSTLRVVIHGTWYELAMLAKKGE